MEKPFYTVGANSLYAYLVDGQVLCLDKSTGSTWLDINLYPAFLNREPVFHEQPTTAAVFTAAYHEALTTLQQAGHALGLTPAQAVITTVEPMPEGVEGVDFADALGEFDRTYIAGTARILQPATERMSRAQEQQIRLLYHGHVPDTVARRFDWRLRTGFTMETAQLLIDELSGTRKQVA
ncbi:hypothetical protein [Hymenobacter algoricola]|uniref:Uncharacterized protein n=1 Tax=Hymenobacter algoricola TaxID=486267 RepID=A0ABP7NBU4_9BACT